MKTRNFFYLALAFVAMSCAEEIAPETDSTVTPDKEITYVPKVFTAGIEQSTKTTLENGYQLAWNAGDKVSVHDNVGNTTIVYKADSDGASTTLSPATAGTGVAENATEFYAIYPQRKYTMDMAKDMITAGTWMNENQRPSRNNIYVGTHFMMSKADDLDNFNFKTLNGFIKVTLGEEFEGKVKSMYIFSNNDESLTGNFTAQWNDGDPIVAPANTTNNRIYARVFTNGDALNVGDYYFCIIPTEFSEGFTLWLQLKDGTQLSKRTEKTITVNRNQILPMKELAMADYDTDNVNYFILYNEGFTFKMGETEVNKTNYPNSLYRSTIFDTELDLASATGTTDTRLVFISPGIDNIKIDNSVAASDKLIIGMEKKHRSNVTLGGNLKVEDGGTNFVLANLQFTLGSRRYIVNQAGAKFGDITLKNCGVYNSTYFGIYNFDAELNSAYVITDIDSFVMEDCDVVFNTTGDACVLSTRKASGSTIDIVRFNNNVIHNVATMAAGGEHRILNSGATTVKEAEVLNNTFSNLKFNGPTMLFAGLTDALTFSNNLYVVNIAGGSTTFAISGGGANPTTAVVENNYYYLTDPAGEAYNFTLYNSTFFPELSVNPFSSFWDPVNATFGGYTISPVDASYAPGIGVFVGAKRDDMTAESAGVDSPAYGYGSNDLGSY